MRVAIAIFVFLLVASVGTAQTFGENVFALNNTAATDSGSDVVVECEDVYDEASDAGSPVFHFSNPYPGNLTPAVRGRSSPGVHRPASWWDLSPSVSEGSR